MKRVVVTLVFGVADFYRFDDIAGLVSNIASQAKAQRDDADVIAVEVEDEASSTEEDTEEGA